MAYSPQNLIFNRSIVESLNVLQNLFIKKKVVTVVAIFEIRVFFFIIENILCLAIFLLFESLKLCLHDLVGQSLHCSVILRGKVCLAP